MRRGALAALGAGGLCLLGPAGGGAAPGPHASGGFHTERLGHRPVWQVSAPRLRQARPGLVWDMAWACPGPGYSIIGVTWQALRYAPPSGLAVRVVADGQVVWQAPDAWFPPSPAPGAPFLVRLPHGSCDVHLQLWQMQAREQHARLYWVGAPGVELVAPSRPGRKVRDRLIRPHGRVRPRIALVLRWRPDPRANYYNVQLFRGGRKVLSRFPAEAQQRVSAKLLSPGAYLVRVWSGLGPQPLAHYAPRPWLARSFRVGAGRPST